MWLAKAALLGSAVLFIRHPIAAAICVALATVHLEPIVNPGWRRHWAWFLELACFVLAFLTRGGWPAFALVSVAAAVTPALFPVRIQIGQDAHFTRAATPGVQYLLDVATGTNRGPFGVPIEPPPRPEPSLVVLFWIVASAGLAAIAYTVHGWAVAQ